MKRTRKKNNQQPTTKRNRSSGHKEDHSNRVHKPVQTPVQMFFDQLSAGHLKSKEYSIKEDKRRANVLGVSNKALKVQLRDNQLPTTLASFRCWQQFKASNVSSLAKYMSKYDDLHFVAITPRDGGLTLTDCDPDILCDEIDQLFNFVMGALNTSRAQRNPAFGCIEMSSSGNRIQPHAHIVCRKATVALLQRACRKSPKRYRVKPDLLKADEPIPDQCVRELHYTVKGATWTRENGKPIQPEKDIERVILRTLDQLEFENVIISYGLEAIGDLRPAKCQTTLKHKQTISQASSNRKLSKQIQTQKDGKSKKLDRIGWNKWKDLPELTRQNALRDVNSSEIGWAQLEVNNVKFDAAFLGREGDDSLYAIKTTGNKAEIICLNDNTNRHLKTELGQAGIQINANSSLENFKRSLEGLRNLQVPIRSKKTGLIKQVDKRGKPRFAYALNSREYCGDLPAALYNLKGATVGPNYSSVSGNADIWAAKIAPFVRTKPIPLTIIGYALSTPLRQLKQVVAKQIDQSSLILCGGGANGKTTLASAVAQGLYGPTGEIETFNATINAINEFVLNYIGRCAVVDDLSKLDVGNSHTEEKEERFRLQALGDAIMRVDDGKDKRRQGAASGPDEIFGCIFTSNDTPNAFEMIHPNKREAVLGRSIQLDFPTKDCAINTLGLEPEYAMETLNDLAENNHGWIVLQFSSALCDHLNADYERTVGQIISDYEQFLALAKRRHPDVNRIGKRVMKQFALMYATLRFANRSDVLPEPLWGSPKRPLCEAMKMALQTAGLVSVDTKQPNNKASFARRRCDWNINDIEARVLRLMKKNIHRFADVRNKKFEPLTDQSGKKTIFLVSRRKGGDCLAINGEHLLKKVFPLIDNSQLEKLRDANYLLAKKKRGYTIPIQIRRTNKSQEGKTDTDRCYVFRVDPKLLAQLSEAIRKKQYTKR